VPRGGAWRVCLNSDAAAYGGSNSGEGPAPVEAEAVPMHGQPFSIALQLPPLGALLLIPA
jgi:1,4-alpha-glucan branching enzyme